MRFLLTFLSFLFATTIVLGADSLIHNSGQLPRMDDSVSQSEASRLLYQAQNSDAVATTQHYPKREHRLRITSFKVGNKYHYPQDTSRVDAPLGMAVGLVKLNHSQNNVEFNFDNLEENPSDRSRVEYILRGRDKEFIKAEGIRSVSYSDLVTGSYSFVVRRVVGPYRGVQEYIRLDFVVRPPLYASNFALFVYFLIVAAFLIYVLRLYDMKRLAVDRLSLEQRDHQREKEYNQAILRFFTNVSHELRTPLTIISGQLEHILESNTLDQDLYRRAMSAFTSATKLQSLVDELLDLRKQQNGYATLNLHRVDMEELVKEIFVNYMELAADRGLKYRLEIEECDGIYAYADRIEMEKVLFNLLSNAFKFTRQGSVEVMLSVEEGYVVLAVQDSGKGIDEENLEKIFEQYYQEVRNGDFDPSVRGTGIGLALVNHIVTSHNGTIDVESKLDEGSRFTVKIPIAEAEVVEQTEGEDGAERVVETMVKEVDSMGLIDNIMDRRKGVDVDQLILVVEDNVMMQEFLRDVLSKYYRVEVASDGQEGYERALELLPSLVLSDAMMPNVSGTQMCTMLKSNPDTSHIPVVILTAKVAMEHKIQGLSMGADDYLTKPFSIKLLVSRIDNILKNRKLLKQRFSSDPDVSYKQVAAWQSFMRRRASA